MGCNQENPLSLLQSTIDMLKARNSNLPLKESDGPLILVIGLEEFFGIVMKDASKSGPDDPFQIDSGLPALEDLLDVFHNEAALPGPQPEIDLPQK